MKKLFISCPMRGRTDETIRESIERMHRIAEAVFGEELEIIPSYIGDAAPQSAHESVWYLGESIKMMAEADYFIGIYDPERAFNGCIIENHVASLYKIPCYLVNLNYVAPDVTDGRAVAKMRY